MDRSEKYLPVTHVIFDMDGTLLGMHLELFFTFSFIQLNFDLIQMFKTIFLWETCFIDQTNKNIDNHEY